MRKPGRTALRQGKPKAAYATADLERDLNRQFGTNAVARGREVFAATCARCHSSIPETAGGAFKNRDFRAMGPNGMRADWMGSDQATLATEVGTNRCRALHSNHMTGHIWQEYGSETLRARAPDPDIKEPHDGGRGYYRNISLLSAWAHAPFMHNNAIGPELCGKPENQANDFYRSPYVDANGKTLPRGQGARMLGVRPERRGALQALRRFDGGAAQPGKRVPKMSRFDQDVRIALGPRTWDGSEEKQMFGFTLVLPAGTSVGGLASFQHKAFVNDIVLAKLQSRRARGQARASSSAKPKASRSPPSCAQSRARSRRIPSSMVEAIRSHPQLVEIYSSCTDGHREQGPSLRPGPARTPTRKR